MGIGDEGETIPGVEAGTRVKITAPVKVYHAPKQKVPWLLEHLLALGPTQWGCWAPVLLRQGLCGRHALQRSS